MVAAGVVIEVEDWRTDEDLVRSAQAGDRDAQQALFVRHVRAASDLAYRLLGRSDELPDIIQDSFVAVFSGLNKLSEPRTFRAWLNAIVTRTVIATIRRRRLLVRLGFVRADHVEIEEILSCNAPPDVLAELRSVYESLDSLPAAERVVLVLYRVEQLRLEEVARRTGFSLAKVKRRLKRAEEHLRTGAGRKGEDL